jgi:hypothetical protein
MSARHCTGWQFGLRQRRPWPAKKSAGSNGAASALRACLVWTYAIDDTTT